jgi:hypothetical protein
MYSEDTELVFVIDDQKTEKLPDNRNIYKNTLLSNVVAVMLNISIIYVSAASINSFF